MTLCREIGSLYHRTRRGNRGLGFYFDRSAGPERASN